MHEKVQTHVQYTATEPIKTPIVHRQVTTVVCSSKPNQTVNTR